MKTSTKIFAVLALIVLIIGLVACGVNGESNTQVEQNQQDAGVGAIINNQPIPDLGGYSLQRQELIELYEAQNKTVPTWSYSLTMDGKIIELCPSYGYPIPGGTQLSNPQQIGAEIPQGLSAYETGVIGNPEPNGVYPPATSAGTYIMCTNQDGTISPMYFEPNDFTIPYRIHSDIQLQRVDNSTPSIVITAKGK